MQLVHIKIEATALARIMHWVRRAGDFEVSGFGNVVRHDWGYEVVNPVLIEQSNMRGHTEIDGHALGKAMYELRETPGEFNFWWHSHGRGSTFFSGTDRETIEELGSNGWLIASVFNVYGQSHSGLFLQTPNRIYIEPIPLQSEFLLPIYTQKALTNEYETKVKNYRVKRQGKKEIYEEIPHPAREEKAAHSYAYDV